MLKVGLTGGLASGKTFVGQSLAELGCYLIQADVIGHEVLLPSGAAYQGVIDEFGEGVLAEDGTIDRRRLAAQVFSSPEILRVLNGIVHPVVRQRTDQLIAEYAAQDPDAIIVVEAAIHIETGGYRRFDKLILAVCTEAQQVERAMKRDGSTQADAEARLRNQMSLAEKLKFADYVINTSGTKEATLRQVEEVYDLLRGLKL
ncbi:MAG: dephospho-CoA kinase [Bryobacteraceae bacterium]